MKVQGKLVPKLSLGPFLTLSVRNGHKLKDGVFRIPGHREKKSLVKTITNILFNMTKAKIPNFKLKKKLKL